jgi:hypothetical protein
MIKLELPAKPTALTDELILELTARFKADGSAVWKKKFIEEAVSNIAFGKCCYSECKLGEEGKYMELDHFYPKALFPDKVVEWGNLLPANKKCNIAKGDHNTQTEPIINPCKDNPKEHLFISGYRSYSKTEIGKRTIEVVALNDRQHFVDKRYKIGNAFSETLNGIYDEIIEDSASILMSENKKIRIIKRIKSLFQQATRENEYAATVSTVILTDEYYPAIEQFFLDNKLWDQELTDLKAELLFCCLIK